MAIKEVALVVGAGAGVVTVVTVVTVTVVVVAVVVVVKNHLHKDKDKREESEPYNLLLIVPADKLCGIITDSTLTKDNISKLLQNTKHAYCFSANDKDKESVVDNIKLSNDKIDNTKSINVLVHIELKAYQGIEKEITNFDVKRKIPNELSARVKKIKILTDINSVRDFYEPL